ncbi:MAG TPA: hypothetical protein VKR06_45600 [Ktedonosporobacter sp.]|nr:hypothetical protein [Ktedonosporobacter sp.]
MNIAVLERDLLLSDLLKIALELVGYRVLTYPTLSDFFASSVGEPSPSGGVDLLIMESDQSTIQKIAKALSAYPDLPVLQTPLKVSVLMRTIETRYRQFCGDSPEDGRGRSEGKPCDDF